MPSIFPFDFIVTWIRPARSRNVKCIFCNEQTAYEHFQYIDLLKSVTNMDAEWARAIAKQMKGNYEYMYSQPECLECTIHFAAIQLGKIRPVKDLLTLASIVKKQKGEELSQILVCTVRSLSDEGDNWIVSAPNTTIEDVVQHMKATPKPHAK